MGNLLVDLFDDAVVPGHRGPEYGTVQGRELTSFSEDPGQALGLAKVRLQQEFGIAAALSIDRAMMAAYAGGDPYLAFAKQAGAGPVSATKSSHAAEREKFKACVLAVQNGMAAESLSLRLAAESTLTAFAIRYLDGFRGAGTVGVRPSTRTDYGMDRFTCKRALD